MSWRETLQVIGLVAFVFLVWAAGWVYAGAACWLIAQDQPELNEIGMSMIIASLVLIFIAVAALLPEDLDGPT